MYYTTPVEKLSWAKHEAMTFTMVNCLKSERAEPIRAMRQDLVLFVAHLPTTKIPKAIASDATSPEALMVTYLIIKKGEIPASQLMDNVKLRPVKSKPPRDDA